MSRPAAGLLKQVWRRIDKFLSADACPDPVVISNLAKEKDFKTWRVFSDAAFGGKSQGYLDRSEDGQHAVFHGRYDKSISEGASLVRAGFVGVNSVFPRPLNINMHDYLEFRVRAGEGDRHTYVASVRTDQFTGGDEEAWQAPLRTTRPGEWEDVCIPLDDLVFTFRGRLVKEQARMPRHALLAVGITLSASQDMPQQGDFKLEVASVTAKSHQLEGAALQRKLHRGWREVGETEDEAWARKQAEAAREGRQGYAGQQVLGGKRARAKQQQQQQ